MNTLPAKLWKFLRMPKHVQLFIMRLVQDQFLVGVTGVILNDRDQVLLFKHTYRRIPWSLPGGYIKSREHPSESLEREIAEESGFVVSADRELKIRTDRETSRLDICFTGSFIGGTFTPSAEVSDYGFFSRDDLPRIDPKQLRLISQAFAAKRPVSYRPPRSA